MNVTKPVLYYYFKDKPKFVGKVVNERNLMWSISLASDIKNENDPIEILLRNIIKLYIEFLSIYPNSNKIFGVYSIDKCPNRILENGFNKDINPKWEN